MSCAISLLNISVKTFLLIWWNEKCDCEWNSRNIVLWNKRMNAKMWMKYIEKTPFSRMELFYPKCAQHSPKYKLQNKEYCIDDESLKLVFFRFVSLFQSFVVEFSLCFVSFMSFLCHEQAQIKVEIWRGEINEKKKDLHEVEWTYTINCDSSKQ